MRVLLVDDHDLFRTGLRTLLSEHGFDVASAATGEAALRRLGTFAADVVVLDLHIRGLSGVATTERIAEEAPDAAIIILTFISEDEQVLAALRAGACGYLLKDAPLRDLVAAIQSAAEGLSPLAPRAANALVQHVRATGQAPSAPAEVALSARERQVLGLIMEGYENTEIAARLYVSTSTVKSQVTGLLAKLGVSNRVQAAVYAVRHSLEEAA